MMCYLDNIGTSQLLALGKNIFLFIIKKFCQIYEF